MATRRTRVLAGGLLAAAAGCATVPGGPSVMSLPGSGKTFAQFRVDDAECRQFAHVQVGGTTADQAAAQSAVASAALGTAVGAVAGAAIDGSPGAAVGAGTGLLVGSAAGAGAAQGSAYAVQRRYDHAYLQCMYAQGNRVPVWGQLTESPASYGSAIPPPPRGAPPPPPPGY